MSTNLSNQNSSNSEASRPESVEPSEAVFSSIYDSNLRSNDSPLINNFNLALQVNLIYLK